MGIIVYIIFLLEVYVLVKMDKKKWGTFVTPFSILALTYTGVTSIAIIYSYLMKDVKDFYFPSLVVWGIGLMFFYLPSKLFANPNSGKRTIAYISRKDDRYNAMFVVSMIFIAIGLYKVRSLSFQFDFGTDDFGDGFGSSGLLAHITMFLTGVFAYFVCKLNKKHKLAIVPIVLIMIIMFAQSSKTRTLTPLLAAAFAAILSGKIKMSAKVLVLIILAAISFFILAYYLSLFATGLIADVSEFLEFISMHFLNYFIGSPLSFSLDYQMGIVEQENISGIFEPFVTVLNKLFNLNIEGSFENQKFIDMGALGSTNVRTFFGTLYAYSHSLIIMVFITVPLSIYIHALYYLEKKKNNIFLTVISALNLTYLVFGGFFDFYWGHIYPFEIVIIFILLYLFSKSTF